MSPCDESGEAWIESGKIIDDSTVYPFPLAGRLVLV
jgi:hypothetical protein